MNELGSERSYDIEEYEVEVDDDEESEVEMSEEQSMQHRRHISINSALKRPNLPLPELSPREYAGLHKKQVSFLTENSRDEDKASDLKQSRIASAKPSD